MRKTPIAQWRKILIMSLLVLWLLPLSVTAEEADSLQSGGNSIGIEFTEDYVPAEPVQEPEPEPEPTPEPKPQPKPNPPVRLPQTGEATALSSSMLGVLLLTGVGITYIKRRGTIEKK